MRIVFTTCVLGELGRQGTAVAIFVWVLCGVDLALGERGGGAVEDYGEDIGVSRGTPG